MQVRSFLKAAASLVIILSITACEATSKDKDHSLQEKISRLESQIYELQSAMDVLKLKNLEQQNIMIQKDTDINSLKNSLEFDPGLMNSNIESHYGAFNQGVWGAHIYSGYMKTLFQRIFFKEDYLWMEGGKVDVNPVEKYMFVEQSRNHLLGLRFVTPVTSKVNSFPQSIKETWLYGTSNNNKVFILSHDNQWFAYDIYDSSVKADFMVLQLLLNSYEEWTTRDHPDEIIQKYANAISDGDTRVLVELYGGDYEWLAIFSPVKERDDKEMIFENYLKVIPEKIYFNEIVEKKEGGEGEIIYTITFKKDDGSLFDVGNTQKRNNRFQYTVKNVNGRYRVMNPPPYQA